MAESVLGVKGKTHRTFDASMEMKDAGLIAASAAAQVDSSAAYIDMGTGLFEGEIEIEITVIEIASNDEVYHIFVEGASETAFDTTCVPLAQLQVGALEVLGPGSSHFKVDSAIGKYFIPFSNERGGVYYRYARIYIVVAGTIATGGGINFTAYCAKRGAQAP